MTDADAKVAVFKAVLKGYFLQHKDIQKLYPVPTEEQLKKMGSNKDGLEVLIKGREKAFELFWRNIYYGPKMNGDGTPVNKHIADIANDFLNGKPVCFHGIGDDNFVKMKAGAQRDIMYKHFLDYNVGKKPFIDPYIGSSGPEITTNYRPELDAKYNNMSSEKPKGGGWWNKIVKAFTGHSSARWAAYDAYKEKESIIKVQDEAKKHLNGQRKVTADGKDTMISRDPLDKKTVETTFTMARNEMATVQSLNNTNISAQEYEDQFSKAFETTMQKHEEEPQKEEVIEEPELDEEDFKPQKSQKDIEKEQLLAKKEAREKLEASVNEIISQIDKTYEKDKTKKIKDLKSSDIDTKKFVNSFMTITKFVSEPDAMPLKADKIADHLTNMYLAGKLLSLKGTFGAVANNNENPFGVICMDLNGKNHPLFDEIRNSFLIKNADNELSMAERLSKMPSLMETMLSKEGLEDFVQKIDQRTGSLIEQTANKNLELATKNMKFPEPKEKTNSNPSL